MAWAVELTRPIFLAGAKNPVWEWYYMYLSHK